MPLNLLHYLSHIPMHQQININILHKAPPAVIPNILHIIPLTERTQRFSTVPLHDAFQMIEMLAYCFGVDTVYEAYGQLEFQSASWLFMCQLYCHFKYSVRSYSVERLEEYEACELQGYLLIGIGLLKQHLHLRMQHNPSINPLQHSRLQQLQPLLLKHRQHTKITTKNTTPTTMDTIMEVVIICLFLSIHLLSQSTVNTLAED